MKKFMLMTLLVAVAMSANAATIVWGASGALYYGATKLTSGAATGYLVYLGPSATDWYGFDVQTELASSALQTKATTALGSIGTANSFVTTLGSPIGGVSVVPDVLTDGVSSFGVMFLTTQGGQDYYYLGNVFTFNTASPSYNTTTSAFTNTTTASPSASSTWIPVPEPATAALALAGLAMLIRRRK